MFTDLIASIPAIAPVVQQTNAAGLLTRLRLVPANWQERLVGPSHWIERLDLALASGGALPAQFLALVPGRGIVDVAMEMNEGTFSEERMDDPNGPFYRPTITGTLPRDRAALADWFARTAELRWLALVQDRNYLCRLVGTPNQPLKLTSIPATGARDGRNARTFSLTADVATPALFVPGISDELVLRHGTFNSTFSRTFDFS